MERPNPIEDIKKIHIDSQKEKLRLCGNPVTTDIHEISKREAFLANEPFMDATFAALSLIYAKQESFEDLLLDTEPRRWTKIINTVAQWTAIAILFLLFLSCSGSVPI